MRTILYSILDGNQSHVLKYLDSSVSLIWDVFQKDCVWLLYLDLSSPSDAP